MPWALQILASWPAYWQFDRLEIQVGTHKDRPLQGGLFRLVEASHQVA